MSEQYRENKAKQGRQVVISGCLYFKEAGNDRNNNIPLKYLPQIFDFGKKMGKKKQTPKQSEALLHNATAS